METAQPPTSPPRAPRRKPSRWWYALAAVMLVASAAVFAFALRDKAGLIDERLGPMPRFVAPTTEAGVVITIKEAGKHNVFYENRGSLDGRTFDTPRRQVWTTYESPSMVCEVFQADTDEPVAVRLPGQDEADKKSKASKDPIVTYDVAGMQGHSAWVFDVEKPGDYRVVLRYVDAVSVEPGTIEIPAELTKADKKQMAQAEGDAYEARRRETIERAALAEVEPIDVLFAVGPDPMRGSYFEVIGLKGAAAVLAFGFTFSVLIALVTLMLRSGHVTPRGELAEVRRGLPGTQR